MSDDATNNWHGFALAYAEYLQFRDKHRDLSTFHRRRLHAYMALLHVDPLDPSDFDIDTARLFEACFEHLARQHAKTEGPFADYLVIPRNVADVAKKHSWEFSELVDRMRVLIIDSMAEAAQVIWGPARRVVTDEDLAEFDADDAHKPDPSEYF